MTIRTRITLQFSVFTSLILILFSVIIYILFSNFRHEEFIGRLKDKALNSVKLLADVDEVNHELLKIIDRNAVNPMPREKVVIIDFKDRIVYSSPGAEGTQIDKSLLDQIRLENTVQFSEHQAEGIGILFKGKYDHYVVVASAFDQYGLTKLNYLRNILLISDVVAIILIALIGLFFSKQALQPLSKVVSQIDKITATNLNLRVQHTNSQDEIAQLATKFNKMLERLHAAFAVQRSFVANASHELRTPLTTLTGQLEVTLMNEVSNETRLIVEPLLQEIRDLNKLSNGLLELTQANQDLSEISLTTVRIDDLMGSAQAEISRRNKNFKLILHFNEFPEESWLLIEGNEQLLRSAIINVIENACKYSTDKSAFVQLSFDNKNICIQVIDNGIGIPAEQIEFIFEPFFRSPNAKSFNGHGIGLTLTKKIIEIHNGTITVTSKVGAGTTVTILIPHI